jgi:protein SCO1/2
MTQLIRSTFIAASTALLLSACGQSDAPARSGQVVSVGEAQIGGPWELIDQDGNTRTDQDFLGKPQLIYFGFAFCPDVCPVSLGRMGAIAERIDPTGEKLNYLFITVDPERDTQDVMQSYVTNNGFAPGLVGLTGSREASEAAQDAFKVYAVKREDDGSAADYLYDHTDFIYVLDGNGKYFNIIKPDDTIDAAAATLRSGLDIR